MKKFMETNNRQTRVQDGCNSQFRTATQKASRLKGGQITAWEEVREDPNHADER